MKKILGLAASIIVLLSLKGQAQRSVPALLGYPQTIIYNAKIVSVSDSSFTSNLGPTAQAMAIRDRKILAVGTNDEMRALAGPQTKQINLGGRTVIPGMIMVHNHPMDWAPVIPMITNKVVPSDIMVNRAIYGPPLEQYKKLPAVLEEAVRAAKPGAFIQIMFIWDMTQRSEDPNVFWAGKYVTKEQLDKLAPNNPVMVRSREAILRQGRQEMLNQKAIDMLLAAAPNVPDRGELKEAAEAAQDDGIPQGNVYRTMFPEIVFKNRPDLWREIIRLDLEWWAAKGQTTFGSFLYHYPEVIRAFRLLDRNDQLANRVAWGWGAIPDEAVERDFKDPFLIADLATREGTGTDYMWYIGTGIGGDEGAGCTSLRSRVQRGPDERRPATLPPGGGCKGGFEKDGAAWNLVKYGGRYMGGHQWGDVGVDHIMNMILQASKAGGLTPQEIRDKRHVADHMNGWPRPDQIPFLKELGFLTGGTNMYIHGGSGVWMKEYGEQAVEWVVPRGSLVKSEIMSGIEIDKPIELTDQNAFIDLLWTIQRKGQDGKVYAPNQKISREIALKTATIWGAYYVLKEKTLGSLEPGKLADFLVLDKDYLTVPEDQIDKLRILMTVVGDKVVHLTPSLAKELGMQPKGAAVELGGVEGSW